MTSDVVFFASAALAAGSAIAMILARNAVHAALFLVATQIALAILFLLQGAFFIAALQIILYAGAIMVLFVFVVMLLGVDQKEALLESLPHQRPMAIGIGVLLIAETIYLMLIEGFTIVQTERFTTVAGEGNVESIARSLFTRWAFPFEATSVLLVVAIVGVIVLARRRQDS